MATLRRTKPASPLTPVSVGKPFVFVMPALPAKKTAAVKKVTGKAFVLSSPIVLPDDGRTNYREVVNKYKTKIKNPKSAIRAMCVECSGGSVKEVQMCPVVKCALYPFRLGQNPFHQKTRERLAREAGSENTEEAYDEEEDNQATENV